MSSPDPYAAMRMPIPVGNLDASILFTLVVDDFRVAWDAMARCNPTPRTGANFMFARQALGLLELAARTASALSTDAYLRQFARRLAERNPRYFTELPGPVPLPADFDFRLPAISGVAPDRQLLAALFDCSRHGLAHLYQQTPVRLTDGRRFMTSFTGVQPGDTMAEASAPARQHGHLDFLISENNDIYLVVRPDLLMLDLEWSARLAAIFSQFLAPEYLSRPRASGSRSRASRPTPPPSWRFSSDELRTALLAHGHRPLGPPSRPET